MDFFPYLQHVETLQILMSLLWLSLSAPEEKDLVPSLYLSAMKADF